MKKGQGGEREEERRIENLFLERGRSYTLK